MEQLYTLIQFLSFVKGLKITTTTLLVKKIYHTIEFPVMDFLEFISFKPVNHSQHYKFKKTVNFLLSLQKLEPISESFSDDSFRNFVGFPYISLTKKNKYLVAEISISNELYNYSYPFSLSTFFLNYIDKYDLHIKLHIITLLADYNVKKKFNIAEFLEHYKISNKKRADIKERIVIVLENLTENSIIEKKFTIYDKNGRSYYVTNLNVNFVSQIDYLFFYEKFPKKFFIEHHTKQIN
jgi:hypothetical protein